MKKYAVALLSMIPLSSFAEDYLKPYINMDVGVSSTSNVVGKGKYNFQEGRLTANFMGVKGSKNFTSDLRGFFKLEAGYSLEDTKITGQDVFSREAYVGLETTYGSVLVGRQWEMMFENLTLERLGPTIANLPLLQMQAGPFFNLGLPSGSIDYNRAAAGFSTPKSIKYISPTFNGVSLKAMWGDGENNKNSTYGETVSLGASWKSDKLRLTSAYTNSKNHAINNGLDGIKNWGVGGYYKFDSFDVDAMYTNTKNTFTGGGINSYVLGMTKPITGKLSTYVNYAYMDGNAKLGGLSAHQFGATLDYRINRYFDVYLSGVYQIAKGDGATAYISGSPGVSSGKKQSILHVGVRFYYE